MCFITKISVTSVTLNILFIHHWRFCVYNGVKKINNLKKKDTYNCYIYIYIYIFAFEYDYALWTTLK